MSNRDVIRAWKDEEFRAGLSEADRARLPENPAGAVELPDDELGEVAGGAWTVTIPIAGGASYAVSCAPAWCRRTVHNGTCAFLSRGCCRR